MESRLRSWAVCVALSWVSVLASGLPLRAEVIERVMAVVGAEMILQSDVRAARVFGLVDSGGAGGGDDAVLSRLIDRALVLAEVDRYAPPEPTAAAVDDAVRRVRSRFASTEAVTRALAETGIDDAHLRAYLRDDLRIRAYLDQRFTQADRQPELVDEWIGTLRKRALIVDLSSGAAASGRR